jgi:phosphonatase-like hydrolase
LKSIAALAASQTTSSAANTSAVRLVVLDVGGTIIQDRGDVPIALRKAFGNHGLEVDAAEIVAWRGASKRDMVRHFVDLRTKSDVDRAAVNQAKLSDAIYRDFSAQLDAAYNTAQPIDGVEEAFIQMRKAGLLLATTSGFDRELTASMFRRLKWQEFFVASISGQDVALGRPAPFMIFHAMEAARITNVGQVVAVGDTPLDLQSGNNAGVRGVVGVLTGAGTAEALRKERYTHILDSVASLPKLLSTDFL